jgi:hypothetical protein
LVDRPWPAGGPAALEGPARHAPRQQPGHRKEAAEIFLLQQVETILAEAAQLAGQLRLGEIEVLESGSPASLAELVTLYPAVMRGFLESVRDILGIDVLSALALSPDDSSRTTATTNP